MPIWTIGENKIKEIPNTNKIGTFLHCRLCLAELPDNESPESYARYSIGYTEIGLQIWCTRHNCNIIHIDFAGQKFYANTTRKPEQESRAVH